jgi:YD repeat-containing protein
MNASKVQTSLAIVAVVMLCVDAGAGTTTYQYDALGRLALVTEGPATVRYSYDPAGSRIQKRTLGGAATTITMPSSTALEHGGSVVLKVNVGGTTAAGSVSFYESGSFIGSAIISNGVATVEIMGLARGSHTFTATYSGDVANAANSVTFPVKIVNLDWLPAVLEILMN